VDISLDKREEKDIFIPGRRAVCWGNKIVDKSYLLYYFLLNDRRSVNEMKSLNDRRLFGDRRL
jgi:hypothetical protein